MSTTIVQAATNPRIAVSLKLASRDFLFAGPYNWTKTLQLRTISARKTTRGNTKACTCCCVPQRAMQNWPAFSTQTLPVSSGKKHAYEDKVNKACPCLPLHSLPHRFQMKDGRRKPCIASNFFSSKKKVASTENNRPNKFHLNKLGQPVTISSHEFNNNGDCPVSMDADYRCPILSQ